MMQVFSPKDYFSRFLKLFSFTVIMGCSFSYAIAGENESVATEATMASTLVYDLPYFEKYNAITVLDMLRRIPSAGSILSGLERGRGNGGARGFGSSGDQILINGKRIAGKTNDISSSLTRIQASQVERIELIRGASAGLDVRSDGLIINIILNEGSGGSTTSWWVEDTYVEGLPMGVAGSLSHSGAWNALDYIFTLERQLYQVSEHKDNLVFDPAGILYEDENVSKVDIFKWMKFSTNLQYSLSNGAELRLNGLYEGTDFKTNEDWIYSNIDLLGQTDYRETIAREKLNKGKNWEFGGDYQGDIKGLGQLKILFILNQKHGKSDDDRRLLTLSDEGFISYEFNDVLKKEKIIRASVTKGFGAKHQLEYGMEGALNSLEKIFRFDDLLTEGLDVIEDTSVSEKRFEGFVTHSYNLSPKLTFQSSLNGEYSDITQKGNIGNSRNFFYLKPRFDVRYDMGSRDQMRIVVERIVGQLNFEDFAIKFNANDGDFEEGNPNLVPEKTWKSSLTYEHRFAEDGGAIEIMGYYNLIKDHMDKIELSENTQGTGNIGNAREYGLNVKSSFRLGMIGLADAVLSADATVRSTRVTDPFTGEKRHFRWHSGHLWRVNFQHDVSQLNMSYGMELKQDGPRGRTEIDDQVFAFPQLRASAFMEVLVFGTMKLRLEAKNLLKEKRNLTRNFYEGNIADDVLLWRKEQERFMSRKILLSLRGTF